MAEALPTDQNELENQLEQGATIVASIQPIRDRTEDGIQFFYGKNSLLYSFILIAQPEPTEDRRPLGFGPCRVCNTNKICVFFISCRHLACCNKCSNECSFCPICGKLVTERVNVYEPN
jgi:hypothetical protein